MRRFAGARSATAALVLACGVSDAAANGDLNVGKVNKTSKGTTLR